MTKLQRKIETNHSVSLAQLLRYLTYPDKREGKAASSVMITLRTPTDYNTLKRHKIMMLFEHKKVMEYFTARSTDQCRRYQAFGHHHAVCTNPNAPTCTLCAGGHPTNQHSCEQCPTRRGRPCAHTKHKCTNCVAARHTDTADTAFNSHCPTKASTLREAWQHTRPAPDPTMPTPTDTTMTTHAYIQPYCSSHQNRFT
jgi:hypothetical protein